MDQTRGVDIIAGCEAFVSVSRRGSFTYGAAERGIPQSVASKRIASLENHLGGQLLDRSTRRVELTELGRTLLPSASAIVALADGLRDQARRQLQRPVTLMMPTALAVADLSRIAIAAGRRDLSLRVEMAEPAVRGEMVRVGLAEFSVQPVPAADAVWQVDLGVASTSTAGDGPFPLESIRVRRGKMKQPTRKLWIQTEDDVPHIRDRITSLANSISLQPGQLKFADTLIDAVTGVAGSGDLLLCSEQEADHLQLHWRNIQELHLVRGYALASRTGKRDAELLDGCALPIACALGGRSI